MEIGDQGPLLKLKPVHWNVIFKPGTHLVYKIVFVRMSVCVCVCVCVSIPRLLITSGVICSPYDWLNKSYSCDMATVVVIINGFGLGIATRHRH